MRKVLILIAAAASLAVAGCNTIEGIGRDLGAAGDAVADTARETR